MAIVNVNIRMDDKLKLKFEEFCNNIGMTMTTAFTVFAKESVAERKIPFEIIDHSDPFYSESNMKWLKESIKQLDEGKCSVHELVEV